DRADPRRPRRRRLRQPLHGRAAPRPLLLAPPGQRLADAALQHAHGPQRERHGDVLQDGARGPHEDVAADGEPVRHRARAHRPAGAGRRAHLRGPDQLQRPHLRRRQEDQLEGRRRRVLAHPPLQPAAAEGTVLRAAAAQAGARAGGGGCGGGRGGAETARVRRPDVPSLARRAVGLLLLALVLIPFYRLLEGRETGRAGGSTLDTLEIYVPLIWAGFAATLIPGLLAARTLGPTALDRPLRRIEHYPVAPSPLAFGAVSALASAALTAVFCLFVMGGKPDLIDAMSQLLHARYLAA